MWQSVIKFVVSSDVYPPAFTSKASLYASFPKGLIPSRGVANFSRQRASLGNNLSWYEAEIEFIILTAEQIAMP
jgi:hypothetical protein